VTVREAVSVTRGGDGPTGERPGPITTSGETPDRADAAVRLALAGGSVVALAIGLVGGALDVAPIRTVGLLVYCGIGLGAAPWGLFRRMRPLVRISATGLTALSALTLVAMAMMVTGFWRPYLAFGAAVALTVPMHVLAVRRARRDLRIVGAEPPAPRRPSLDGPRHRRPGPVLTRRGVAPAVTCGVLGGLLCLGAASQSRHVDPGLWGFLIEIGPMWYVGLGLVLVATVMALGRPARQWPAAVCVSLLMLVVTLTPALVYDGPRSQSAAKHVDLVEQIRHLHHIDSTVEFYNAWPGFFAAMAWLCDVCGIADPIGLATAWPGLLGLYRVVALRLLADRLTGSPTLAWTAVVLAMLADPIGADYFSPQSVGFVVGLLVVGVATSRLDATVRLPLVAAGGCVLALSHQLSPYIVGGVLVVLTAFRLAGPWWTPALVLGPAVVWTALHRDVVSPMLSLSDVGDVDNFRPPGTVGTADHDRLPIVSVTVAALVAGILVVGLIALAALVRGRRDRTTWALAACPAVGLLLVGITPYGQEGIFRATLFGIPWLAILAARRFHDPSGPVDRRPPFALVASLAATFLLASFGLDGSNVLRRSDLEAFRQFQQHALVDVDHRHFLLNLGAGDLPSSPPTQDLRFSSMSREAIGVPVRQEPAGALPGLVRLLTDRLVAYSGEATSQTRLYAMWSPVSSYYGWEYGLQRPEQFAELREAFRAAPYWHVVYESAGTVLFMFDPAAYASGGG
jgi:hypothetical protein